MAEKLDFEEGDFALVDYGQIPRLWHQRFLAARVINSEFLVATPDFDMYVEDISLQNNDFEGLRRMIGFGQPPPGLGGATVYGFDNLTAADWQHLRDEGRRLATAERRARGLGPVAAPDPGAVAALVAAGPLAAPVASPVLPLRVQAVAAPAAAAAPPAGPAGAAPAMAAFLLPWWSQPPASCRSEGALFRTSLP